MASAGSVMPGSADVGDRGAELACAARQRFGRKPLSHCASTLVEIEGFRSRLEEDQLQGVAGDGRRFKIQSSGVVRAELIGIVFSGHHRNCIGRWPM